MSDLSAACFPPVRGAIICSLSVHDTMFDITIHVDFVAATRPKYNVTLNLHNHLPRDLDLFVCPSSTAGQIGSHRAGVLEGTGIPCLHGECTVNAR